MTTIKYAEACKISSPKNKKSKGLCMCGVRGYDFGVILPWGNCNERHGAKTILFEPLLESPLLTRVRKINSGGYEKRSKVQRK